jgi:branched-chain amino acid transport system permease protein
MRVRRRRWHLTDLLMAAFGVALLGAIAYGSLVSLASPKYGLADWADLIVFGVAQGSVYGLIALGYTMVYGTLRMINFAHGEVFACGALTTYFLASYLHDAGLLSSHPYVGVTAPSRPPFP